MSTEGHRRGARLACALGLLLALGCHTGLRAPEVIDGGGDGRGEQDGSAPADAGPRRAAIARAGDDCGEEGARACTGESSKLPLVCHNEQWQPESPCDDGQRCNLVPGDDQGRCLPLVPGCDQHPLGETFCWEDARRTCSSLIASADDACDKGEVCATDALGSRCLTGTKACQGHAPGLPFCAGDTLRWCADGLRLEQEPCPAGMRCLDADGVGRCSCDPDVVAPAVSPCASPAPTVIADLPQIADNLSYDHGALFFHDAVSVQQVGTEDGAVSLVQMNGCGPLYGFAVDEDRVYVGTCDGDGLIARDRISGMLETIVSAGSGAGALDVAALGGTLVFTSCGAGFNHVPIAGGKPIAVDLGLLCATTIAVSGDRVLVEGLQSTTGSLIVSTTAGGHDVIELGAGTVLAADQARVFVGRVRCTTPDACDDPRHFAEIVAMPALGGAEVTLAASSPSGWLVAAASDGRFAYVTEVGDGGHGSSLFRVPVDGGPRVELAATTAHFGAVALGPGSVYYWEGHEPARLMRVAMPSAP